MLDFKQLILSILLLDYTINESFILKKLDDPSLLSIIWMVKIQYWFGFNPYKKMMEFVSWNYEIPNIWKVIKFHGSKAPTSYNMVYNSSILDIVPEIVL